MPGIFEQVFNGLRIVSFVTISSPVGTRRISEAQSMGMGSTDQEFKPRSAAIGSVRGRIHKFHHLCIKGPLNATATKY